MRSIPRIVQHLGEGRTSVRLRDLDNVQDDFNGLPSLFDMADDSHECAMIGAGPPISRRIDIGVVRLAHGESCASNIGYRHLPVTLLQAFLLPLHRFSGLRVSRWTATESMFPADLSS